MTTIIINTYDAAGRFDMDSETSAEFFNYIEKKAVDAGYGVERVCVDVIEGETQENIKFIEDCFQEF